MRNPAITSAIDSHGKTPVGSLSFVKDFGVIFRRSLQSINIHTHIGCVDAPSASGNEEINGMSTIHRRCSSFIKGIRYENQTNCFNSANESFWSLQE
jgi:hypothetical protein